ncbi:hypothetical protein RN001_004325 [Aquatica leii]|uniref:Charged multivesicular body protein 5 n=1 Tax=Aquatica leii TaxID=1421715 RepID=A0AAN7PEA7_9COLE|nr:hypothetical protein RN001_004325 [Aquatica leii]
MSKMREGSDKNAVKAKVIRVLKQKKIYEQQLDNLRAQSFNMNQCIFAKDIMKDNSVTIQAMKDAARQLKKEYKNVNVADIENVQEDLAEMMVETDDIQGALGQCLYIVDIDEDEINTELDALGEEIAFDDDTSYIDDVMKAPDASKHEIETEREKPSKSNDKSLLY